MPATASEQQPRTAERAAASAEPAAPRADRRRWRPRWTLRLRLTLLYGALFLIAGAVLLAITYGLVANSMKPRTAFVRLLTKGPAVATPVNGNTVFFGKQGVAVRTRTPPIEVPSAFRPTAVKIQRQAQAQIDRQRNAQLDALLTKSIIALGIMAFVSIGLGWLMAGRALRPVRTMSARARGISERNLNARLALEGPDDELKELGDTFDGLLGRLEMAFESQRRFVANASHELRTPITVERTLVEVALADPDASAESLTATCERVLAAGEQQERLIEALLTLARSQRGIEAREPLDLAEIARAAVRDVAPRDGTEVLAELTGARTSGDAALVERLVANLLDNALHYNTTPGWVRVRTWVRDGRAALSVVNTGPEIAPDDARVLTEPFRRLNGNRTGQSRGLGLGLSIVEAIATAHGADLRTAPRAGGGLEVEVVFPHPHLALH